MTRLSTQRQVSRRRWVAPVAAWLLLAAVLPVAADGAISVCPTGCNKTTIQAAINAAQAGEIITVTKEGTYAGWTGLGAVGITIRSQDPNSRDAYIIDGFGVGPVARLGSDWVLEGFTITGGLASPGGGVSLGSGSTIRNCVIRDNKRLDGGGGGIFNATGSAPLTVENSDIRDNEARFGGGISTVSDLTLRNSKVHGNNAIKNGIPSSFGGGIDVGGDLVIEDSQIFDNTVTGSGGVGGGIRKGSQNSPVRISNTSITGNASSGTGGGLAFGTGTVEIAGGSIVGNAAVLSGGGVQLSGGSLSMVGVAVTTNVAGTSGGGIHCSGSGVLQSFSGFFSTNVPTDLGGSCAFQCATGNVDTGCSTGMVGVCTAGRRTCGSAGVWGQCVPDIPAEPKEIFCSDGLDEDCDGDTDLADEDCQDNDGTPAETPGSGTDGDPVRTSNGTLFERFTADLNLGGPLPLAFSRYYASDLLSLLISGRLGDNWRHNFEWSLVDNTGPPRLVDITSPHGRRISFELVSGSFELRGLEDVRYQLSDTGATLTLGDPGTGRLYVFDATGKLVSISDGTSNTLTLAYTGADLTSVSDGLGRTLTFTYTGGDLTQVTDGLGRTLLFGYTGSDLTSFTDARAKTTTYIYAPGGLMTSWTLPRLNTPYAQTYDGSGRVVTQTEAPASTHTFSYNDVTRVTTLTDPAANTRAHTHSPDGQLTDMESEDGQSFSMAYNSPGDRIGLTDRFGDSTAITTHPPSGKRASITHADGTTTTYSYAARTVSGITFYDLSRIDYPDGTFESLVWSNSGDLISRLDRGGNSWTFIYNDRGQLESFTNPAGGETTQSFRSDGNLASRTDPAGNTTTFGYDAFKRLDLITYPLPATDPPPAPTRSFTYDNADNLLTVTDERTNTTSFTYDDNGNLATIVNPITAPAAAVTFGYDAVDRLASVTDALGNASSLTYDSLGRVATAVDRESNTVTFGYDPRGRLTSVTDGALKAWLRGWDVESIPASATDPLGNTAALTSDKMGRITRLDTPLGHATSLIYDSMGRVTRVTDPVGEITDLSYDARGLLAGITHGGLSTTIARDELGRITSVTDPNGQAWLRAWDNQGRLTSRTDPLAQQQTFTYDDRNRVDLVTLPGGLGTLTPSYDAVGNVTRRLYAGASGGVDLNFFTYDNADRLTSAEGLSLAWDANDRLISCNGLAITRDLNGRIGTLTLAPGKTLTYSYDARGLLVQVTDWVVGPAAITSFSYDDAARLTTINRPNGVHTTLGYDADSRLVTMSEGALSSSTLTYDAAGKITRADRTVPTAGDASGATPVSHTYDAASQVATFTYDALGRLTADGTRTYVWDLASRLTSATQSSDTVTYTYDALGSRLTRTEAAATRGTVWNYALGLPSVNVERLGGIAGADLRYYVTTPGGLLLYSREAADDARRDYHYDQIGNTLFLSDAAGAVVASYAYDPYGQLLASAGVVENAFTWQGRFGVMSENGVTGGTGASDGLYYLRARYYDSGTRRFLSRDPVPSLDPTTVNPYQYAAGAPTRFVDPMGLEPGELDDLEPEDLDLLVGFFDNPAVVLAMERLRNNPFLAEEATEAATELILEGPGLRIAMEALANNQFLAEAKRPANDPAPLSGFTCGVESSREAMEKAELVKARERLQQLKADLLKALNFLKTAGSIVAKKEPFRPRFPSEIREFAEKLRSDVLFAELEVRRQEARIQCLEDSLEDSDVDDLSAGVVGVGVD